MLNFCANNYLGLADDPRLVARGARRARALRLRHGVGALHLRHAERAHGARGGARRVPRAPTTRSSTSSCFDANGGLFETLLAEEDAVISDELNHASIVDGIRLCKAKRYRYRNNDMADLEAKLAGSRRRRRALQADRDRRRVLDGRHRRRPRGRSAISPTPRRAHDGRRFARGRLRRRAAGAARRSTAASKAAIDILTGTLGKALGGASGGYIAARQRDRRPAAPAVAAVSLLEHARAVASPPRRSQVLELLRERRRRGAAPARARRTARASAAG